LNIFENNPAIWFVDGRVRIFDQNLKHEKSSWNPSFRGQPLPELLNISDRCFFGQTWMIRRKKNKRYHFNESITHGEDLLFYIESALYGGIYDYTDEVILHYRKGHQSAMKNLAGLENGYRYIYGYLINMEEISKTQAELFQKKAKQIILKSYLGHFNVYKAFLSLLKKW
jgi:hypothetical protein